MSRALIFLDVDGVLNTPFQWETGSDRLDPGCVLRLHRLVRATDAHVVLSSSWRLMHRLDDVRHRTGLGDRLIGATPDLVWEPRGMEIAAWLKRLHARSVGRPFVILDDDNDMVHLLPHLVQTDFNVGLTAENVADAIAHLRGKGRPVREILQGNRNRTRGESNGFHCRELPRAR